MAFAPGVRDPIDMARQHKYMTVITDYDSAILSKYEAKLKASLAEKKRLEDLKAGLDKATKRLLSKKAEQKSLF